MLKAVTLDGSTKLDLLNNLNIKIMHKNERKAKLKKNQKDVVVYQSRLRGTWIDSSDLITEYKPEELVFE